MKRYFQKERNNDDKIWQWLNMFKGKVIQRHPCEREWANVCGTWDKIQVNSEGKILE